MDLDATGDELSLCMDFVAVCVVCDLLLAAAQRTNYLPLHHHHHHHHATAMGCVSTCCCSSRIKVWLVASAVGPENWIGPGFT